MTSKNWAEQDIEEAIKYISEHEVEAKSATILDTDHGITILLPQGLPAYGAHFIGIFMMAPILLFMAILIFFTIQILWSGAGLSGSSVLLTLLCLLLFWALTKILQLMMKNRDLFPRRYFATLGSTGVTMHFSRFQFPLNPPRMAIRWTDIKLIERSKSFFLPGLFCGNPITTTIAVNASNGEQVLIPFRLPENQSHVVAEQIETLISSRTRR